MGNESKAAPTYANDNKPWRVRVGVDYSPVVSSWTAELQTGDTVGSAREPLFPTSTDVVWLLMPRWLIIPRVLPDRY